jgi:two-component system, LuxR family, response regulator FixJ
MVELGQCTNRGFLVFLMLTSSSTRAKVMENASAREGPVVLVVHNDNEVRNSLKFLLEVEGFLVKLYDDARALLDDAELPRHGGLVVEYNLPGLNGLAALEQLRRRGVLMPAILITSHLSSAVQQRSSAIRTLIIEKPLLGTALIDALREIFDTPPG